MKASHCLPPEGTLSITDGSNDRASSAGMDNAATLAQALHCCEVLIGRRPEVILAAIHAEVLVVAGLAGLRRLGLLSIDLEVGQNVVGHTFEA